MPFLLQIDAVDLSTGASVPLRAASVDAPEVCHLNGEVWWPVIETLPKLRYDIFGGDFGRLESPDATVIVAVSAWNGLSGVRLAAGRIRLWHGADGADWAGYTLRFDGRVRGEPVVDEGSAEISFGVDDQWRDKPLLATYAGTGGGEGPEDQKGMVKPLALGQPLGAGAVLINATLSLYQIHGYGPIAGVDVVLERLARQHGSPLTDYPTYAALAAATIPAGSWTTCLAQGMMRFGAPPNGRVCFMMRGDASGGDWVRLPGAVLSRIATLAGHGSSVDAVSMAALDAACPYPLSLWQSSQTSARSLMEDIAGSVNAAVGMTWLGQLVAVPIRINAPGLTIAVDGSSDPAGYDLKRLSSAAPWWRMTMGARPFWQVHGASEYVLAEDIIPIEVARDTPPTYPREGQAWRRPSDGQLFVYTSNAASIGAEVIVQDNDGVLTSGWIAARDLAIPVLEESVVQASEDAGAALLSLDAILSDQWLTREEKPRLKVEREVYMNEQAGLDALAVQYGLSSERAAYDGALAAFEAELATLYSPTLWDDVTGDTSLAESDLRSLIVALQAARRALKDKIAERAALGLNSDGTVKDGQVVTASIDTKATYDHDYAFADYAGWRVTPGYGVWTNVDNGTTAMVATITVAATETAQIVKCDMRLVMMGDGSAADNLAFRVLRDGTTALSQVPTQVQIFDHKRHTVSWAFIDDAPTPGSTHSYQLQFQAIVSDGHPYFYNVYFDALCLKK